MLQKSFPIRPVDDVGQGAAVLMALVMLRIAECQERTISFRARPIGAERQETDDQRRSEKSHRCGSPAHCRQR
jgi:hypothetical protein